MCEMDRVIVISGCMKCMFKNWGICTHHKMKGEICPNTGFVEGCPLTTTEEIYNFMKTEKYYEDHDW